MDALLRRSIVGVGLVLLAACAGQSPTASATAAQAADLDRKSEGSLGTGSLVRADNNSINAGGGTFGSGNVVDLQNTTAADSGSTAGRGGGTFGSGN